MKLFPDHWANEKVEFEIVATPVGAMCIGCPGKISDGDRGLLLPHAHADGVTELAWHRDCFMRAIGL